MSIGFQLASLYPDATRSPIWNIACGCVLMIFSNIRSRASVFRFVVLNNFSSHNGSWVSLMKIIEFFDISFSTAKEIPNKIRMSVSMVFLIKNFILWNIYLFRKLFPEKNLYKSNRHPEPVSGFIYNIYLSVQVASWQNNHEDPYPIFNKLIKTLFQINIPFSRSHRSCLWKFTGWACKLYIEIWIYDSWNS